MLKSKGPIRVIRIKPVLILCRLAERPLGKVILDVAATEHAIFVLWCDMGAAKYLY